ncbi:MAG: hypothetical protein ACI38U_03280 [Corynebacterium sp.]|uniref:hypothetical protein n=1 Tax=Corynebacterium sp. TaxID=1720 RepID=UPI003EFEBB02
MSALNLDDLPVGTVIDVGGLWYIKTLRAAQTMPGDNFFTAWHRLERGEEVSPYEIGHKARRYGIKTVEETP